MNSGFCPLLDLESLSALLIGWTWLEFSWEVSVGTVVSTCLAHCDYRAEHRWRPWSWESTGKQPAKCPVRRGSWPEATYRWEGGKKVTFQSKDWWEIRFVKVGAATIFFQLIVAMLKWDSNFAKYSNFSREIKNLDVYGNVIICIQQPIQTCFYV